MSRLKPEHRILGGMVIGILGYIIGALLQDTNIFPSTLQLDDIGLFLGVIYGAFKDILAEYHNT